MKRGFTLIELVVVIFIIGIIAGFAVPMTIKIIETSKAQDAIAVVNMVSMASRMARLDYPGNWASGQVVDKLDGGPRTCPASGGPTTGNELVGCKYLAEHSWKSMAYDVYACDGAGSGGGCCADVTNSIACGMRKSASSSGDFARWRITFSNTGACSTFCSGGCNTYHPPACPQM